MYPLMRKRLPEACDAVPADYGTVLHLPLEWGYLGIAGPSGPNGGRVVCPGGGTPRSKRLGSRGPAREYHTTAPASMTHRENQMDIIDVWQVRCPDEAQPRIWYFNLYRCGSPCMPHGFHLMHADATELYQESIKDMEAKDYISSLELAREAQALEPTSESINARLATAYLYNDRPADAFAHFQRASGSAPHDPFHRLHAAVAKMAMGDDAYYRTTVEQLMTELPSDHGLLPELSCRHAHALQRAGEFERANAEAASACTAGQSRCCWKR